MDCTSYQSSATLWDWTDQSEKILGLVNLPSGPKKTRKMRMLTMRAQVRADHRRVRQAEIISTEEEELRNQDEEEEDEDALEERRRISKELMRRLIYFL
ncbi:hypothetical protein Bca52824_023290 [Brassica carinata]|uniref:Uncharacterized protein n=1 Tax=Brassica carinata TaxID=52824 RepID=A0A8X7VHK5_BRACI|nr:hypothetical protein Bca52824_023290 [Brassica carinata]